MKIAAKLAVLAILVLAMASIAPAGDQVTLTGKIACAHCTLKKPGVTKCQDVLVVTGAQAGEYYITKNAVAEAFGHVCGGMKPAKVTGKVSEKDGRKWIEASKMEEVGGQV
jgi:hypothetical protein